MKTILHTLTWGVLALAAGLLPSSCNSDFVETPVNTGQALTFQLATASHQSGAVRVASAIVEPDRPGIEALNENKIERLDVFFYKGTQLLWHASDGEVLRTGDKVSLPLPADKQALFRNNTAAYDVYVVANATSNFNTLTEGGNNLAQLNSMVEQTPHFVERGGAQAQAAFLFDGHLNKVVSLAQPNMGVVELKRAAAKVTLRVTGVDIPGYTSTGSGFIRLCHFVDKTSLLSGGTPYMPLADAEFQNTGKRILTVSNTLSTAAPFYCYAQSCTSPDVDKCVYAEISLPLAREGTSNYHNFRYLVPIIPPGLDAAAHPELVGRIARNTCYDIAVTINILGSEEVQPVVIDNADYTIADWSTKEVLVDVRAAKYFSLSQYEATMSNITNYEISFASSNDNVRLVPGSLKATYTYVPINSGTPTTQNVATNQRPTVTVDDNVSNGKIHIQSALPTNYLPKDIEFQVTNGDFTETVKVRQFPSSYFTTIKGVGSKVGTFGYWRWGRFHEEGFWGAGYTYYNPMVNRSSLPSGNNNPYMYCITSKASGGSVIWGFPPTNNNGTLQTNEVQNMVSPSFEMASQFGATRPSDFEGAQFQANNYVEYYMENGVRKEKRGWRLPTRAEILYIKMLQDSSQNPYYPRKLLEGEYYWSANGSVLVNSGAPGSSEERAHIRLIRDIK